MVPLIRLLYGFDIKQAIAISNATVFISGLIRFIFDFRKKSPTKKDPITNQPTGTMTDYNFAILMMPMGSVGAAVGAIVSLVMPEPITIGIMTAVLIAITIYTIVQVTKMCREERKKAN